MPLRSRRLAVIPHGWAAHHRPVIDATKTATCLITRDREGVAPVDPGTGDPEPWEPLTLYTGPCRVQVLRAGGGENEEAVGETIAEREVQVTLVQDEVPELRAGRQTGDWVTITAGGDDPQMADRRLRINTIGYSSLAWERVVICIDEQTSNNPPPYIGP